jgi:hypothetical protein
MAKAKKEPVIMSVTEYLQKLDHPLADAVEALRQVILKTDKEIGEQVKWNSPSFYYTGEMKPFDPKEYKRDIVVFNLHKKEYILLIFPTGATIKDTTGVLEGQFTDGRRMVKIESMKDVKAKEKALQTVIKEWLKQVDKGNEGGI